MLKLHTWTFQQANYGLLLLAMHVAHAHQRNFKDQTNKQWMQKVT